MIQLIEHEELVIRCDAEFAVMVDGHLVGPDFADARVFKVPAAPWCREVEIATTGRVEVEKVQLPNPLEHGDNTPMDIPLSMQEPESMRDIIRRYVQEYSLLEAAKQDRAYVETEEEADDFEIEEESPDFISDEEYREMEEDKLEREKRPPAKPEVAPVDPAPEKPVDDVKVTGDTKPT